MAQGKNGMGKVPFQFGTVKPLFSEQPFSYICSKTSYAIRQCYLMPSWLATTKPADKVHIVSTRVTFTSIVPLPIYGTQCLLFLITNKHPKIKQQVCHPKSHTSSLFSRSCTITSTSSSSSSSSSTTNDNFSDLF